MCLNHLTKLPASSMTIIEDTNKVKVRRKRVKSYLVLRDFGLQLGVLVAQKSVSVTGFCNYKCRETNRQITISLTVTQLTRKPFDLHDKKEWIP